MSITAQELKFVEQLISQFSFEKIKFSSWVEAQPPSKKKKVKRLLVVSKYRVFLLKKSGVLSKNIVVESNFHLYQLAGITSAANDTEIVLNVAG